MATNDNVVNETEGSGGQAIMTRISTNCLSTTYVLVFCRNMSDSDSNVLELLVLDVGHVDCNVHAPVG
jgi:hypothetical protein